MNHPGQVAFGIVLLGAVIAIGHFWGLGAVPLYSVGEPREAVQVVSEFEQGSWILPLRNGSNLPSKPPLYHWLAGLTALAAGRVDEWVVRFPSAAVAAATLLAVAWFAARRWDAAAGLAAACILATNVEWLKSARAARVDMTLTGSLTAALLALGIALEAPRPPRAALAIFYLGMALATLAKGPLGIVLPVLVALVFLALRRDLGRLRDMHVVPGLAVAVGIPAIWYALATLEGGLPFVEKQLLRESVFRFLAAGTSRVTPDPAWYYVHSFAGGFAPWSPFLVPLALYLWQHRRTPAMVGPYAFPLVWLAVVIGFFSAAAGKRSNYILAAYPAAALLLGGWWSALWRDPATLPPVVRRVVRGLVVAVAAATALVVVLLLADAAGLDPLAWVRPFLHRKDQQNLPLVREVLATHRPTVIGWALSSALAAALLVAGARRERWPMVFAAIVLYVVATTGAVQHAFLPRLAQDRTYKPFVAEVVGLADDGAPLVFFDTFDFGVVFYARRVIPVFRDRLPEPPAWIIMSEPRYQQLPDLERARLPVRARSTGTGPGGTERYVLVRASSTSR